MNKKFLNFYIFFLLVITGCSSSENISNEKIISNDSLLSDTIKAGRYDTGKMWTFEYPPVDYFKEEYDFSPGQQWFDDVRLSALKFSTICSASFISEDGLIMTNNHCARESAVEVSREGEDLQQNGFYAETLEDERQVPGLFVDQLVLIKDVTEEVHKAIDKGYSEQEKLENEELIIAEIETRESNSTGLSVTITPLYNGARYSLYGYKRFNDIRLVFTPEHLLGHFGGEYDNFTYPRYNLDCAFFRVYENGRPLKTENFLKWSVKGARPGEPVFVVGNPGSTSRLHTISQLEYMRDVLYPQSLQLYISLIDLYKNMILEEDSLNEELQVQLLKFLNAKKVYEGMIDGLNDSELMQRKKDFENNFKLQVQSDPELNDAYGDLWEKIGSIQNEMRLINNKIDALTINPETSAIYFFVAQDVVDLADELSLPEAERSEYYKGEQLDTVIASIIPLDYEQGINKNLLVEQLKLLISEFGTDDPLIKAITGGKSEDAAAEYMLEKSFIDNPEELRDLLHQDPRVILNSDDPFIYFTINSLERMNELELRSIEISENEAVYTQQLGKALFEVYGTSIPPDATFTLRISDGVVGGYPYNGTTAPPVTTFYGLYDRYYSFNKKEPWNLPGRWINPPADFDLSIPFNFVSTNDITGGSSGSPVINRNAEIVGVAFDGNIESLPGNFIFRTEQNRMVSVHSEGIIEALSKIYKTERLVEEILSGKIVKMETVVR